MAAGFRALCYQDVSSGFRGADSLGSFPGHVHDLGPGIVSALKVFPQILVLTCPRKSGNRRSSTQGDPQHIFLDLKQQMIDAEWFFGSLANGRDFGLELRGVERRRAKRAQTAGVGYGRDQRSGGRGAHTS